MFWKIEVAKSQIEVSKSQIEVPKSQIEVSKSQIEVSKSQIEVSKSTALLKIESAQTICSKIKLVIYHFAFCGFFLGQWLFV